MVGFEHDALSGQMIRKGGARLGAFAHEARAPKCGRDRRLARLAFLAPDIQRAILTGEPITYPVGEIPLSWCEQRRLFGFAWGGTTPESHFVESARNRASENL